MNDSLDAERLAQLQAILTHWDIPPVTAIAMIHPKHLVCKITTAGPTFILKNISDAPNLTRLAFTHDVLTQVARTGLRVPIPLLTRSAQPALAFQGQYYLLSKFIEASEYPQEPERRAELFYHTGQAIAKLHQALAAYPSAEASQDG